MNKNILIHELKHRYKTDISDYIDACIVFIFGDIQMEQTRKQKRARITSSNKSPKTKKKLQDNSTDKDSTSFLDDTWLPATSTYNYMMKDPLLDWLKHHHGSLSHKNRKYSKVVNECNVSDKSDYNFTRHIMRQGVKFEDKVMKLITKKFTPERVAEIHGELAPRDPKKYEETLEAMLKGVPIIHSGVLHDPEHKTFGIPDLLVRSDWIHFLVREPPHLLEEIAYIKAPKLNRQWHYCVIDIKFTALMLRADAGHLLNAASFPAYKAQLLVYNWALGYAQGYTPQQAYILGRRWRYTSKGETFVNDTCFDKFGIINYVSLDQKYVEETEKALDWVREVRSEDAADWNTTKYPLDRWELYPNMCNSHDSPWHAVKQQLADDNKELTNLWMVGPKNRAIALKQGICKWTDPKCTAEILGITGQKTGGILDEILRVNQSKTLKITPEIITTDIHNWKERDTIEFFVDFETCNGVISDIKWLPSARTETIIFMIGVGYIDPHTKKWVTKDFICDKLTLKDEETICNAFSTFIQETAAEHGVDNPKCIHWARAEESFWNDAVERHNPISDRWNSCSWEWMDLLEVFKEEPIVVNGAMSFGLKDVAKAMKSHGFIQSEWDKTNVCVDGQSAMVAARHAHKLSCTSGKPMRDIPIMKQILKYNRVDVRVLYEIITYLREHHIQISRGKKRSADEFPSEIETGRPKKRLRTKASLAKRSLDDKEESPTKRMRIDTTDEDIEKELDSVLLAMNDPKYVSLTPNSSVSEIHPSSSLKRNLRPRR